MRPFVIVSRVTAAKDLASDGNDYHNVAIVFQENAFRTSCLFEIWTGTVFVPSIDLRRRDLDYQGKGVFLLDGQGAHNIEKFHRACRDCGIDVILLVPPAPDRTQPLSLITFALINQPYSASKFSRPTNPLSNKVVRILGASFAPSAPHHSVEIFMNAGLRPTERSVVFYFEGEPLYARRFRIWPTEEGEIPPAPLSRDAARRIRLVAGRRNDD
jgi:hypothetical protein